MRRIPWQAASLTPREREIAQVLAERCNRETIAADLHISAKTIETHRQHIVDQLNGALPS